MRTAAAKITPVASSTSGYRSEIGRRQRRQRPRSAIQERTGTLSNQRMGAPQEGQDELGRTSDIPLGTR